MIFLATGLATKDLPEDGIDAGMILLAATDVNLANMSESKLGMAEYLWTEYKAVFISWGPVPEGWSRIDTGNSRMVH